MITDVIALLKSTIDLLRKRTTDKKDRLEIEKLEREKKAAESRLVTNVTNEEICRYDPKLAKIRAKIERDQRKLKKYTSCSLGPAGFFSWMLSIALLGAILIALYNFVIWILS